MPPIQVGLQRRHTHDHTRYERYLNDTLRVGTLPRRERHMDYTRVQRWGGMGIKTGFAGKSTPDPNPVENMRMEKDTALSRTLPRGAW